MASTGEEREEMGRKNREEVSDSGRARLSKTLITTQILGITFIFKCSIGFRKKKKIHRMAFDIFTFYIRH